jgi:hypothetical protein
MSAMPARVTGLSDGARAGAVPSRTERRAERREAERLVRRDRRRWTLLGCVILGGSFAATALILDVIH